MYMASVFYSRYREWDLNPHSRFGPKDFKSFVSTDSTIAASKTVQRYDFFVKYANFLAKIVKKSV